MQIELAHDVFSMAGDGLDGNAKLIGNLLVGVVFFVGNTFGLIACLRIMIPVAAVAPILVFVGIVICAQAFSASPARHAMAVAVAMIPHISDLMAKKFSTF